MMLSTRGRYGIHAMYDLAVHYGDGPQSIKQIAERQSVPEAYLEQLFALLKKAKLVISNRGAMGGYRLAHQPEEITVGQVLRALEGGLNLVDCVTEEESCGKSCACPSRVVWLKLQKGLNDVADGITLKDMIDEYICAKAQGEEK